jgi:hypothetical protein
MLLQTVDLPCPEQPTTRIVEDEEGGEEDEEEEDEEEKEEEGEAMAREEAERKAYETDCDVHCSVDGGGDGRDSVDKRTVQSRLAL